MNNRLLNPCLEFLFCAAVAASASAENWPPWRGPHGDGTSLDTRAPVQWQVTNAVWTTAVPGIGQASPIVWGDRLLTDKL